MRYLEEKEEYIFNSGKTASANCGIIGLSPELEVSDGYDGLFHCYDKENACELTKEDKIELADYMINQWQKFKGVICSVQIVKLKWI